MAYHSPSLVKYALNEANVDRFSFLAQLWGVCPKLDFEFFEFGFGFSMVENPRISI